MLKRPHQDEFEKWTHSKIDLMSLFDGRLERFTPETCFNERMWGEYIFRQAEFCYRSFCAGRGYISGDSIDIPQD